MPGVSGVCELGQPDDQARAHDGLAHAHHALHQHEQARRHWQHALDILNGLGVYYTDDAVTTAETIRTHLTDLDSARTFVLTASAMDPGTGDAVRRES